MLDLEVKGFELYDEIKEEFITVKPINLKLEHSLISISKWEAKWKKPFLAKSEKTTEEVRDYIKCMCLTQNVPNEVFEYMSYENQNKIMAYVEDPMTATWFSESNQKGGKGEAITSELIYYWMIAFNIPSEYQKWHINRLLTLIRVCDRKNAQPKKMSKRDILDSNKALNDARRAALKSKG